MVSIVALLTDDTETWMVVSPFLFGPIAAWTLFMTLDRTPVLVVDDDGIRSPLMGWDVRWDEVLGVRLFRIYIRGAPFKMLIVRVSDAAAVIDRQTPRRRRRLDTPRGHAALQRGGVRFPLTFLDTRVRDVIAAVERYVPVER